jgi:hypothetical protein
LNWFIFRRGCRATECPDAANRRPDRGHSTVRRRQGRRDKPKETPMSTSQAHDDDNAPVPWMQQLLDNPFILLFLGVFVPMMVYTVWGVVDILTLPMAK